MKKSVRDEAKAAFKQQFKEAKRARLDPDLAATLGSTLQLQREAAQAQVAARRQDAADEGDEGDDEEDEDDSMDEGDGSSEDEGAEASQRLQQQQQQQRGGQQAAAAAAAGVGQLAISKGGGPQLHSAVGEPQGSFCHLRLSRVQF